MNPQVKTEPKPPSLPKSLERASAMADLFQQGNTLQQIADQYRVSKQYVGMTIKRMGLARKDGGQAVRPKNRNLICKMDNCNRSVKTNGYCGKHYNRVLIHGSPCPVFKVRLFQDHDGSCLVEECGEPFKSNGLCNKHTAAFFYGKRDRGIKDLNDFLKVQLAKRLMGEPRARFGTIRAFMKANAEHFKEDLYKKEANT